MLLRRILPVVKVQWSTLDRTDGVIRLKREPRPGAEWSGCAAPGLGVREDTDHDQGTEGHPGQSWLAGARPAAWQREPGLQDDGLPARQLLSLQGSLRDRRRVGSSGAVAAQAASGQPHAARG